MFGYNIEDWHLQGKFRIVDNKQRQRGFDWKGILWCNRHWFEPWFLKLIKIVYLNVPFVCKSSSKL